MPSGPSTKAVLAAVAASTAMTITKFLAAAFGGSAAMLAEGIHSLVDTGNNLLLYLGQRRSTKPPDEAHPFGYGQEVYFWSLLVALMIFAVGGGVTVAEGISRLLKPEKPKALGWSYAVLGLLAVFNSYSWVVALREFLAGKGRASLWRAVQKVKDPSILSVLLEDSASLVGLVLAFLGLFLADRLDRPSLDGMASVLIGLLMAAVAVGLVYQCKTLLIGESANREVVGSIRSLVEKDQEVEQVADLLTLQLGPEDVLLNLKVRFRANLPTRRLGEAVDRLEQTIRDQHPEVKRIFVEAAPVPGGDAAAAQQKNAAE